MNKQIKQIALISTRPNNTNTKLLSELEDTNISVLNYPLTKISPLDNYQTFDSFLENLNMYQHIIFISTNAVHFSLKDLKFFQ